MIIKKASPLRGEITVSGDKSISHRAIMLGSIAEGETRIRGFLNGADCISTIGCFRSMGVKILQEGDEVVVSGVGLHGLHEPEGDLDCGNSGTTIRILSGLLAGQAFDSRINGDESIQKRPMGRVITPLTQMGADILSVKENDCAPLLIRGKKLHGISYSSPVASAQVKSSVLLAGLTAEGKTRVTEPHLSRNHTELMLQGFGAELETEGNTVTLTPGSPLHSCDVNVPGDISSAAYFIGAALLVPDSFLVIRNVGINPTRSGILDVFQAMGGNIRLENSRIEAGESVADLVVKSSDLHGTEISGSLIPRLIDELPLIAVAASVAEGETVIKDAAELRVKESDRIEYVCSGLKAMGADVTPTEDGMILKGSSSLYGAVIPTAKDHRIAMSFAVAALIAEGETEIKDADCVRISFPDFYDLLSRISRN